MKQELFIKGIVTRKELKIIEKENRSMPCLDMDLSRQITKGFKRDYDFYRCNKSSQ